MAGRVGLSPVPFEFWVVGHWAFAIAPPWRGAGWVGAVRVRRSPRGGAVVLGTASPPLPCPVLPLKTPRGGERLPALLAPTLGRGGEPPCEIVGGVELPTTLVAVADRLGVVGGACGR